MAPMAVTAVHPILGSVKAVLILAVLLRIGPIVNIGAGRKQISSYKNGRLTFCNRDYAAE